MRNKCNHCPALKQSAEASIRLELRLKESVTDKDILKYDNMKLESYKAELIDDLKFISEQCDDQFIKDILRKHEVKK